MSKKAFWDKIAFLQKLKNIKHIEIIVISIFVVILAIIYMSSTSNKGKTVNQITSEASLEQYAQNLEKKLCQVLSRIDGAGKVSVMLTFDGRITYEYATDIEEVTTSSSVSGGSNTKTTINKEVIIITQNGKSTPLIIKEIYPEVSGVVVVASGAQSVAVKLNIVSAVETLLNINSTKIQVLVGSN